jgi:protein-tyrosine kinase
MGKMFDALKKVEREKFVDLKDESRQAAPDDFILDNKLVAFSQPSSMVAEQFRRLRTYIIKPGQEKSPRTILVTSAVAGEGKSLIAINLAITIAIELNSYALLVDCDLRNPSVSRFFGLHEASGLSDYLLGKAEIPDLLVKSSVDKLSLLCSGTAQDNPVELIGSNRMKFLMQDLKSRYEDRYIILDSSPLLATTEPSVLNEMVDGIILVVKVGETPRESVQQAMKLLKKEKILGVVLNRLEFKTQALIRRYFGAHRYYYDYRYTKMHEEPTKWDKFVAVGRDMKMFLGKLRPGKKDNDI